jgi:hypothetical protein
VKKLLALALLLGAAVIMAGCGERPQDQAQAEAIRQQAQQDAADREQARRHKEDEHQADMAERKTEVAERRAISEDKVAATRTLIWAGTIGATILILGLAAGGAWFFFGTGRATVRLMEQRARLIALDVATRQFPLLSHEHGGVLRIFNANTGQLVRIDQVLPPVPQLAAGAMFTQVAGAITQETRANCTAINPPIIMPQSSASSDEPSDPQGGWLPALTEPKGGEAYRDTEALR